MSTPVEQAMAAVRELRGSLAPVQHTALRVYGRYDVRLALLWLTEELGELAQAVRKGAPLERVRSELADVFAWTISLCNILGVEADDVVQEAFLKELDRQRETYDGLKFWDADSLQEGTGPA